MIPALIVFAYLAVVVYIGVFAFRRARGKQEAEDYFLASRSLGPFVFLLSLFGTNMTAFAILGSSGHAFDNGIVTYGLMASSSGLVIPLTIFLIGTRVWALGKKLRLHDAGAALPRPLGVQPHRHRDLRGAGGAAGALHHHRRDGRRHHARRGQRAASCPSGWAARVVALVVMSYVFFGGMRGHGLGEHVPDRAVPASSARWRWR